MRAALALTLGALLAFVPTATASGAVQRSGGLQYVTKKHDLRPGKPRTLSASCPKGTQVLGGGTYNSDSFGSVIVFHSYPKDDGDRGKKPDDAWAVLTQGFTETRKVSVYATCARISPEYLRVQTTVFPTDGGGFDEFACEPASLSIVGGGTKSAADVHIADSFHAALASPDRWEATYIARGTVARKLTVYAICAGLDLTYPSAPMAAGAMSQAVARPACPPNAPHVISGGFRVLDSTTRLAASRGIGIGPGADQWEIWVDNLDPSDPDSYTATAACTAGL